MKTDTNLVNANLVTTVSDKTLRLKVYKSKAKSKVT